MDWINISASWKRLGLTSGFWSGRATPLRCSASREPTRRFKVTQAIICQWALASLCPHSCLVIYIVDNNRRLVTAGFSTERSWREWSTTRFSSRRSPGVFFSKNRQTWVESQFSSGCTTRRMLANYTDYNTDIWDPGFMTIFVAWQLIVTLDSIRNSCDVWICFIWCSLLVISTAKRCS